VAVQFQRIQNLKLVICLVFRPCMSVDYLRNEILDFGSQTLGPFVIFSAAILALCGCSDSVQQDVAKCKLKAIELYRPVQLDKLWSAEPLRYVEECMAKATARMVSRLFMDVFSLTLD
jgi:hypothetical protein